MASIKQQQQDAMASIDTAKAMLDKVLTILGILEDSPSLTLTFATNPIGFLLQMLEHLGVTYEDLRLWLTEFLVRVLPALEIAVKAILLTNLKKMVSCSIDPRIPEKYRKLHKDGTDYNTAQLYGIDINIESIDFLNKLATSPLSEEGSEMYFGLEGVTDVYKFARADDMDAFLWFVIHKAHFPNSNMVNNLTEILNMRVSPTTAVHTAKITPQNGTLLDALEVDAGQGETSILPGNTFAYQGGNIISMCIDAKRETVENKIQKNTLVPVSDDWNSANWYIRRADQLGKNLGFGWEVNNENANTKYKGEGRNYSKERGICNLQYLDQAQAEDAPITGLVNNKLRFSILPKPYIHVPNLDKGEPPWRFKKMLFDSQGNYDPNGKYTFSQSIGEEYIEEGGEKYIKFTGFTESSGQYPTDVRINIKSGEVTVKTYDYQDPQYVGLKYNPLVKDLYECYPGLTVYEFNYDYVMGMRLFDAKVMATTLLDALIDSRLGLSVTFGKERQEAIDELKEIIKNIINSDDSSVSDCFYTFDNKKYEALLRKSEEKRARQQRFGNVTQEVGSFANVREILDEYDANAELHEQVEVLNRAITQATVNITEGVEEKDKYKVQFGFVTDLIEQLTFALTTAVFSPKVLMLLEVNETLMGGKWEKITMKDLITAMRSILVAIVEEIRDLIVQELMKLVLKNLEPIIQMLTSIMLREQVEAYTDAIMEILRNCPFFWFSFGNRDLETKLDTVDYADIDTSVTTKDKPNLNEC